jgi:hypothetical protein
MHTISEGQKEQEVVWSQEQDFGRSNEHREEYAC